MPSSIVVTVIGPDRPGLVRLLADRGAAFGASWVESRMASLAGQFAGIVRFEVAPENAEPLAAALGELQALGLRAVIATGRTAPAAECRVLTLELIGQDHPGIIHDISRALADCAISIDELNTEVISGAHSGGALFQAKALLRVPVTLPTDELRRVLEALANELMVDIALGDAQPQTP